MQKAAYLFLAILICAVTSGAQQRKKGSSGRKRPSGAMPTLAPATGTAGNDYSNNQVATAGDILVNQVTPDVGVPAKVLRDALIIYSTEGTVFSWDTELAKTNWTYKEKGVEDARGNGFSADGAMLYIPFANGTLAALDVNTGKALWTSKIGLEESDHVLMIGQTAPFGKDQVYIAAMNNIVYAVDKTNGSMVWNYRLEYPYSIYRPLIVGDELFVNNAPYVYKFIAGNGRAVWQRGFRKAMYSLMVSDGRRIYAGDEDKTLYAVSPADTSRVDWKFSLEDDQFGMGNNVIAGDGVLFVAGKANPGSAASSVYAVSMKDGAKLWRADLPKNEISDLSLRGKVLYGYMKDGIFALDATTGKQLLMIRPDDAPVSNIIADDASLLYLGSNGLVRYDLKSNLFSTTPVPGLKTVPDTQATIRWVKKG